MGCCKPFCAEGQLFLNMIEISSRIVTSSTDIHKSEVKYGRSISSSSDNVSSCSEVKISFSAKNYNSENVSSSSDLFSSPRRKLSTYNSEVSSSTTTETSSRDF